MVQVQIKCWHVLSGLVFPNIKQQWSFKGNFHSQLLQAYQSSSQSTVLADITSTKLQALGLRKEEFQQEENLRSHPKRWKRWLCTNRMKETGGRSQKSELVWQENKCVGWSFPTFPDLSAKSLLSESCWSMELAAQFLSIQQKAQG